MKEFAKPIGTPAAVNPPLFLLLFHDAFATRSGLKSLGSRVYIKFAKY